jgi:predicted metal-dependent hydrolase
VGEFAVYWSVPDAREEPAKTERVVRMIKRFVAEEGLHLEAHDGIESVYGLNKRLISDFQFTRLAFK